MGIQGINNRSKKWDAEIAAAFKSGWLGIGYTVVSRTTARKNLALASDTDSQLALANWLQQRETEDYVVAIRYYVAECPCRVTDSEFKEQPILLRHSAFGYEVIAELLPLTLDAEGRDTLVEALAIRSVAEEFAFITNTTRHDGHIPWA